MNNLAVVIGVSKYVDERNNLPGCKNDAEAIFKLLQKTEKFGSILYINEHEVSARTKELLTNFIAENKGKPIEEFFFYYTGHGEFTNNEFYYLLSDFDSRKRNQTSLQNGEIDDLVRTLSPNLFIKVIDACQSGTTYIKENNVLSKYLDESKKGFNKCYFLNSSLNNQYSYQDSSISHFTFSFINAIKEHTIDEIRYKDIIDVVSDAFTGNLEQTPFFVIQADLTEKFCFISKGLKEFLSSFEKTVNLKSSEKVPEKKMSLVDLVKKDAKDYVDKEGAINALTLIRKEYENISLNEELNLLYKPEVEFLENYQSIHKLKSITKWIEQNKTDYFASLVYIEKYDHEGNEYYDTEFELKVDVPYKGISIDFVNNFPNILSYNCKIIFILSRKSIRFFYSITNYVEESWENKKLDITKIKWTTIDTKIADESAIKKTINRINKVFRERIEGDLKAKFEASDTTEKQKDSGTTKE